jgi:cytochrome c553
MRTSLITALHLSLSLGLAGAAYAGDYEAGKKIAEEKCQACHGEAGNKPITPDMPRLGGQHYDYLLHSLHAYKSGARNNPMMAPMAQPLSDKDMRDAAWYFSKQVGLQTKY